MRFISAYIYYIVPDKAFERAAKTSAKGNVFADIVEIIGVRTKQDFIDAWNGILSQAQRNNAKIELVTLFLHAEIWGGEQGGLQFQSELGGSRVGTENELGRNDILGLANLPWSSDGYLHISACNSANSQAAGWSPTEVFLHSQPGLQAASGEIGYAYFSTNFNQYDRIEASDQQIYLHAYARGRNNLGGDGHRMKPRVYSRDDSIQTNNKYYLALNRIMPNKTSLTPTQHSSSKIELKPYVNIMMIAQSGEKKNIEITERKHNPITVTIASKL